MPRQARGAAPRGTRAWLAGAAAIVAVTVAACGSGPSAAVTSRAPATTTAPATDPAAPATSTTAATPAATATPSPASTPAPASPQLAVAAVLAVVQRTYPATPAGISGGCAAAACPFTARLTQQLAHLASQTPSPTSGGDICNYDLKTGNQSGLATPVQAIVQLTGDSARAAVSNHGQSQPVVTLVVVDSAGTPLVDDILYDVNRGRSVYSLSCTGSVGN